MVADFASEYGIRLAVADLKWLEFLALMRGLLAADTRLRRHFAADDEPTEGGVP